MRFVPLSSSRPSFLFSGFIILVSLSLITPGTGCGSGNNTFSTQPKLSGNTTVTLLISSTANDQLSLFTLDIKTLTLTSQSGKTVNLLSSDQPTEAIHINGGIEPVTTLSIPQDIYTSATATVGSTDFACVTLTPLNSPGPGGLDISTYMYGYTPDSMVTVSLPSSITVTGSSMALKLDLRVLASASYSSCYPSGSFAITPTFNLTGFTAAPHPTNPGNGKATQVDGQVASIGTQGSTFTLSVAEVGKSTRMIAISANSNTTY